jgi:DnaK suppressor protein
MQTLTKDRKSYLSAILQKEKEKLEHALHLDLANHLEEDRIATMDPSMDGADLSFARLQESLDVKIAVIWSNKLNEMVEAERKLDDGTYGICEKCGNEIGERRLSALPFAIYCVKCAEQVEGSAIRGKGPTL